jgi:hypothetical protein
LSHVVRVSGVFPFGEAAGALKLASRGRVPGEGLLQCPQGCCRRGFRVLPLGVGRLRSLGVRGRGHSGCVSVSTSLWLSGHRSGRLNRACVGRALGSGTSLLQDSHGCVADSFRLKRLAVNAVRISEHTDVYRVFTSFVSFLCHLLADDGGGHLDSLCGFGCALAGA